MYRCYILWCINSIIPDIVINFQHKKFLSVPYYKIFSALLHFHVCIDSLAPMDVSHLVNTIMVPFHTTLFTEGRLVLTAQLTCALLVPRPCSRFEYETHSFLLSLSFVGALKCQNWFYRQLFLRVKISLSTVVLVLATYLTNSSNLLLIHKSIYTTFYKASIQIIDLTTASSCLSLTVCAKFSGYIWKYCHMSFHTGFIGMHRNKVFMYWIYCSYEEYREYTVEYVTFIVRLVPRSFPDLLSMFSLWLQEQI